MQDPQGSTAIICQGPHLNTASRPVWSESRAACWLWMLLAGA